MDKAEALRGASAAVRPALLRIKVKPRIHFSRQTPGLMHRALRLQDLPALGSLSEPPLLDRHLQRRHGLTTDVSTTRFNAYDSRWRSIWLKLVAALIALLPKGFNKMHHHRQQQPQQRHPQQQWASTSTPTPTFPCLVRDWQERYRHHLTLQR